MSYGKMGNSFPYSTSHTTPMQVLYVMEGLVGNLNTKCITFQIILGQDYDGCFDSGYLPCLTQHFNQQMQPEYGFQADLAENLGSFSMEE